MVLCLVYSTGGCRLVLLYIPGIVPARCVKLYGQFTASVNVKLKLLGV